MVDIDIDQLMAVPLRKDEHGVIRVGNTRVTLLTVVGAYKRGETAESILEGFPTLKLSEIHAIISYYLEHREEIDVYMRAVEEEVEQNFQEWEKQYPPNQELMARLRAASEAKRAQQDQD